MHSLPPTLTLPENYQLSGNLDLSKNRRLAIFLNLLGLVLLGIFGWAVVYALRFLRPEFDDRWLNLVRTDPVGIIYFILSLLIVSVIMIVMHEAFHGLLFWMITHQRPVVGIRGPYAYASAPGWFIPRNPYLVVAIAPFAAITALGLGLITIIPAGLIPPIMLLVTLNASGAVADLLVVIWLLTKPASIYVQDYGDGVNLYRLKAR